MHSVSATEDIEAKGTPTGGVKPCRIPQIMATNPIYDGNSTVYDFLPEVKDLKSLKQEHPNPSELYLDIPPQVIYINNTCIIYDTYNVHTNV